MGYKRKKRRLLMFYFHGADAERYVAWYNARHPTRRTAIGSMTDLHVAHMLHLKSINALPKYIHIGRTALYYSRRRRDARHVARTRKAAEARHVSRISVVRS